MIHFPHFLVLLHILFIGLSNCTALNASSLSARCNRCQQMHVLKRGRKGKVIRYPSSQSIGFYRGGGIIRRNSEIDDDTSASQGRSSQDNNKNVLASISLIGHPKALFRVFFGTLSYLTTQVFHEFRTLNNKQKCLMFSTFLLGFMLGRVRPFWKRYTSVMQIPISFIRNDGKGRVLKGRAVSVTDGDTIRFLHQPTPFHPSQIKKGKEKMSETALPIRLCTIDTPETAKFGKPGQPFGIEAKEHLAGLLKDKVIRIRILQTDQYSRAVAQVSTGGAFPFSPRKYMDRELLQAGLAEVYQGGGAVYGPEGKEKYLELEEQAQKKKIGIWSQKKRESAAEYKKRTKG